MHPAAATAASCTSHCCIMHKLLHAAKLAALAILQSQASLQLLVQKEGFTDAIIDRFFKPFLGGIFFDKELNVTSRLFEFVMRMLASGENSLPANGIGAISEQMAAALPAGSIKTGQLRFYSAWWSAKVYQCNSGNKL